jgi:two-component system nitrogen regulation response regulator NtrX
MSKADILIVDDEANTLASLARAFRLAGHEATVCDNAAKALELAKSRPFDLILSDVVMPGRDGLALLEDLKSSGVVAPVVMMSGQAHIEMAVKATRLGAMDFLEKPLSTDKLLLTVDNALRLKRLETENSELRRRVGKHELVWTGDAMRRVMAQIDRVAASESRVCIYGETGTGKELVARTLHEKSARAAGPFVTLNCAAIPAELIESELFGHEKGSFTGAAQRHVGKFEQAHHGTIFLDEIGDMPLAMQTRLLRVLEAGNFRRDLYHRVVVFPITLPPLRTRNEDIPVLVDYFSRQVCAQNGWKPTPFAPEAVEALRDYPWPGNIRELRNAVERLLLLAGETVDAATVELAWPRRQVSGGAAVDVAGAGGPLAQRVAEFEKATLLAELERSGGHVTNAAKALGLERSHFYKKCLQLGIDLKAERA